MRTLRIVALALIALLAPLAGEAVGEDPTPSLAISSTAGFAGTTIHVSGTGCPDTTWDTSLHWSVHVETEPAGSAPQPLRVTAPSGTPMTPIGFALPTHAGIAIADVAPAPDGSWSADLRIPDAVFAAGPGNYPVSALCYAAEGTEAGMIEYAAQTFAVAASPASVETQPSFTG